MSSSGLRTFLSYKSHIRISKLCSLESTMSKSRDRRAAQKDISVDRRKDQRRKKSGVESGAPVRRDEDWEAIYSELKG